MNTAGKKKRRTQGERREESERKLFDALIQIVINEGISAATCEHIGTLAGYSRGLTTMRLGRREEMFGKLIQRLKDAQLDKLAVLVTDGMSRADALKSYIDIHFEDLANDPGYKAYFVLVAGSLTDTPLLREAVIDANEFAQSIVTTFIREGVERGEFNPDLNIQSASNSIGSYLLGAALQHRLHPQLPANALKAGGYAMLRHCQLY